MSTPSLRSQFRGQVFLIKCFWSSSCCCDRLYKCYTWYTSINVIKEWALKKAYCNWNDFIGSHDVRPQGRSVGKWMDEGKKLQNDWIVCEHCERDETEVHHLMGCFLLCLGHRGVSVAPFGADKGDANLLQDAIPCGGVRLQHHPNLPKWSNWIHALQQRSCKCASLNSCQSQQCCHIVWKEPTLWLIRHCNQWNFSSF